MHACDMCGREGHLTRVRISWVDVRRSHLVELCDKCVRPLSDITEKVPRKRKPLSETPRAT